VRHHIDDRDEIGIKHPSKRIQDFSGHAISDRPAARLLMESFDSQQTEGLHS
jgi:hypothetical protein